MNSQTGPAAGDLLQVQQCLRGDAAALAGIRDRFDNSLRAILRARGASATEADDLLADLWGDCVGDSDDHPALLEKFSGKCPLQAWLALVVTNRWYDAKRRQARSVAIMGTGAEDPVRAPIPDHAADPTSTAVEDAIVDLLRDSLKASFAACDGRDMVVLRLVYLYDVSQREVARALGWNESKLSRTLSQTMHDIETHALAEVRKRDPWLQLSWQDFLDLCRTRQIGFL